MSHGDIHLARRRFVQTLAATAAAANLPTAFARAAGRDLSSVSSSSSSSTIVPPIEIIALNRMAFGPRPGDVDSFLRGGGSSQSRLKRYVEAQLHPAQIADHDCDLRLSEAKLATLGKTLPQLWQDHYVAAQKLNETLNKPDPKASPSPNSDAANKMNQAKRADEQRIRHQPVRETEVATWLRAVYSQRQLQEVLADFWHNHFNVHGGDNNIATIFVHYDRDVIRAHAFGNFREMLGAVAKSPAMLFYLDNFQSQSGNPNENYARELFELHTLGVEHYLGTIDRDKVPGYGHSEPSGYVDGDVYEAARCFTGWRIALGRDGMPDTGEFNYYDRWHDRFQKIVLGRSIQEYGPPLRDGEEVLDRVAFHPGTSRHIAFKLCRRLVSDEPPRSLVENAARVFREHARSPDQLARVVRAILLSPEFRSTWGQKMKRPFEVAVAMLRATAADFYPSDPFLNNYARAGQRLFEWPTPDGYPDVRTRWGGTNPMIERWRLANQIATGSLDRVRVDWLGQTPPSIRTPSELARFWSHRLMGRSAISKPAERELTALLARGRNPGSEMPGDMIKERLPMMAALVLMSPDFQLR
jgi:uncharacterized protein (DUF1800 family)